MTSTRRSTQQRRIMSELLSTPASARSDDGAISPVARGSKKGQGVALGLSHPALTPMPAALRRDAANPLGLRHPGLVAMPLALRLSAPVPTMSLSRTQLERIALVERVLAELGVDQVRRGGWSVAGR